MPVYPKISDPETSRRFGAAPRRHGRWTRVASLRPGRSSTGIPGTDQRDIDACKGHRHEDDAPHMSGGAAADGAPHGAEVSAGVDGTLPQMVTSAAALPELLGGRPTDPRERERFCGACPMTWRWGGSWRLWANCTSVAAPVPTPPRRGLHDALARSLGAERGHMRKRGLVAGIGM